MRNYVRKWTDRDRRLIKYIKTNKYLGKKPSWRQHHTYRGLLEDKHFIACNLPPALASMYIPYSWCILSYFKHVLKVYDLLEIGVPQRIIAKKCNMSHIWVNWINTGRAWTKQRKMYEEYKKSIEKSVEE